MGKYCPNQFEIVDAREVALNDRQKNKQTALIKDADGAINEKQLTQGFVFVESK